MIKKLLLFLFVSCVIQSAFSCDVCGSASGAQTLGMLPAFQKHFVGIKYGHGTFKSSHPVINAGDLPSSSTEKYHVSEIRARVVVKKRWQFYAFVPISFLQKQDEGITTRNSGLGDISLLSNYVLVNQSDSVKKYKHTFLLGGGVKLPTGKNNLIDNKYGIWIPNMQLGTGSIDFILNANHILTYRNSGLVSEVFAKFNTSNADKYRFGNRYFGSVKYFYSIEASESMLILPSAGISMDFLDKDKRFGFENTLSGGYAFGANLGFDIFWKQWQFGAMIGHPFSYKLSDGYVSPKTTFQLTTTYLFGN